MTYVATVTRDGRWWMIRIDGVDGITQARRVSEVSLMAREFVAVSLDVPLDEVEVSVTIDSVGAVDHLQTKLDLIRQERKQAAELEAAASRHVVEIAKALAHEEVPLRDVGAILGVSHQRAHQLVSS